VVKKLHVVYHLKSIKEAETAKNSVKEGSLRTCKVINLVKGFESR